MIARDPEMQHTVVKIMLKLVENSKGGHDMIKMRRKTVLQLTKAKLTDLPFHERCLYFPSPGVLLTTLTKNQLKLVRMSLEAESSLKIHCPPETCFSPRID